MNDNFRISFDFDSTLDREDVQEFAKNCVNEGMDVYCVTSRQNTENALKQGFHWVERQNQQLYDVAESVGILRERIIFTEHQDKINYLKDKNFIFHLDDDRDELMAIIESKDPCTPICVENDTWLEDCKKAIQKRSVENFLKLVKDSPKSTFIEDTKKMIENRYWTDTSFDIQIKILTELDNINTDLKTMCKELSINKKCCSGPYDFKLSEIKKIEKYLKINIINDEFNNRSKKRK